MTVMQATIDAGLLHQDCIARFISLRESVRKRECRLEWGDWTGCPDARDANEAALTDELQALEILDGEILVPAQRVRVRAPRVEL